MSRLAGFFQVRDGEGRTVVLLAALTLLLSAGGAMGGNAVDALLFARFGVPSLPGLYVGLGFCIVVSALAFSAALARGARGRFYVFPLAGLALVLVADRLLLAVAGPWVYPASWLAMNVIASLQGLVGWGLAGLVCDTRQAKRLFPLFAAGGVLGSVLGGLATHPLAVWVQTENLLLAWAATLMLAFWLGRRLLATRREAPPGPAGSLAAELRLGFDTVRAVPMLRWLAGPSSSSPSSSTRSPSPSRPRPPGSCRRSTAWPASWGCSRPAPPAWPSWSRSSSPTASSPGSG